MFKSISFWVKRALNVKQLFIIGMTSCIIHYCRSSYSNSKIFELLLLLLLLLLFLFVCFVSDFAFVFVFCFLFSFCFVLFFCLFVFFSSRL